VDTYVLNEPSAIPGWT